MKSNWLGGVAVVAGLGMAMAAASAQVVTIDTGKIHGSTREGVTSYKGIPYAQPPVGKLRWRAPQPVTPWKGVREAVEYGHDCMQLPFPSDAAPLGTKPAEDCLVANVWVPEKHDSGKPLPVMVWIYGGGFVNGGSSPAVYDGSQFAKGGVVLVSFNYRVGRFGFFAFPALSKENADDMLGNYAYMDQLAALKWVQRNAAAFGGDARNVTVFGESAGGGSVHMLMTSPLSEGLFAKAIVESGGGRRGMGKTTYLDKANGDRPSAEEIGVAFAKSKGIEGSDAAALEKLRALPAEDVVDGLNMASMGSNTYSGPMQDGKIVVADPQDIYLAGKQKKLPLMEGANSLEMPFSMAKSMDEAFARFGDQAAAIRKVYEAEMPGGDVAAVSMRVNSDAMLEPVRFVARTLAATQPVYAYRFGVVAESMRKQWNGAPHATEIPFVFDTVKARYEAALTNADEKAAQQTIAYWLAFAKTGNPAPAGLPAWPKYDPAKDELMFFTNDGPKVMVDPAKARLDALETTMK